MGKTAKRGGKFKGQSSETLIQEDRSRQTESLCGATPGRISERDSPGVWMCAISSPQGVKAIEDHTKKKTPHYQEQDYDKVAAYKYEIADIPPEKIAYVDETGIDCYMYREYGYAPKGQLVHGLIKGRKYARIGIVAAQMGKEVIAPCKYSGTMNHELFESWFESKLLPVLPKETVIVMDNASFHRKEQLYCLAQKYDCFLIFLPAYSPELNPIEHFWAWLKRTLRKILSLLDSFDDALFAAFYFRDSIQLV